MFGWYREHNPRWLQSTFRGERELTEYWRDVKKIYYRWLLYTEPVGPDGIQHWKNVVLFNLMCEYIADSIVHLPKVTGYIGLQSFVIARDSDEYFVESHLDVSWADDGVYIFFRWNAENSPRGGITGERTLRFSPGYEPVDFCMFHAIMGCGKGVFSVCVTDFDIGKWKALIDYFIDLSPGLRRTSGKRKWWADESTLCMLWPFTLDDVEIAEKRREARRARCQAVLMGSHARLGAGSPLHLLEREVLELVCEQAFYSD